MNRLSREFTIGCVHDNSCQLTISNSVETLIFSFFQTNISLSDTLSQNAAPSTRSLSLVRRSCAECNSIWCVVQNSPKAWDVTLSLFLASANHLNLYVREMNEIYVECLSYLKGKRTLCCWKCLRSYCPTRGACAEIV